MASLKYILIILATISFSSEKTSSDIQGDINNRKNELNIIKKEIRQVEENIIRETKEAISTSELLLQIETKINLTEKLMNKIDKEINSINIKIADKETEIDKTEKYIYQIRTELKSRLVHLYKNGKPSIIESILNAKDWNDAIYKTKYLNVLSEHEKKLQTILEKTLISLDSQKLQLKKEINYKKNLKKEKNSETKNLAQDKRKRELLLLDINKRKSSYEIDLIKKQQKMEKVEKIIANLLKDKRKIEEKEKELERIRKLKKISLEQSFSKMKKKLPWPINGKIISKYGLIKNKELNTVTENLGIEIKSYSNTDVLSVFDGVVTQISYIGSYVVIVLHGDGYRTVYWGMNEISIDENDYVQAGSPIGKLNKNNVLQFQIWSKNKKENPEKWLIRK